jgi:hypothetical protein
MRHGRALCIGVDTSEGPGGAAEADACALALVASAQGFEPTQVLLGASAARAAVIAKLQDAASACQPGDLFMLTFSGHGGRRSCAQGSASDGSRSTWTLFDDVFDDADMRGALAAFRAGVRVLVISDSCNGGVPDSERDPNDAHVAAAVLVLAACAPDRLADGGGLPGHFTTALLRVLRAGWHGAGYRAFYESIAASMPEYQRPNYYWLGSRDPHFEAQAPLTV